MIERVHGATSLNIAIQDGVDAGQSVPHVHTHIIPRRKADLDHRGGTDAVYDMLDGEEGDLGRSYAQRDGEDGRRGSTSAQSRRTNFPAVDNEERKPRSMEEMEAEAAFLAREMKKEALD
jgi:bis(5'-adenosyl)-triphosphatase